MRDIVFRGKRIDDGKWSYGDLVHYKKEDTRILGQNYGAWDVLESGDPVIPETVGQYTGLIDNNGHRIFEGDIVRYLWKRGFWISEENWETRTSIISWNFEKICWSLFTDKDRYDQLSMEVDNGKFEIIGNIHDNPEMVNHG